MQRELPTLLQFPFSTSVLKKISNILRVSSKLIVKYRDAVRVVHDADEHGDCDPNGPTTRGPIAEQSEFQPDDPVLRLHQARPMGVGTYPFRAIAGSRKGGGVSSLIRGRPRRRDDRMKDHPFPQAGIEQGCASLRAWPEGRSR